MILANKSAYNLWSLITQRNFNLNLNFLKSNVLNFTKQIQVSKFRTKQCM